MTTATGDRRKEAVAQACRELELDRWDAEQVDAMIDQADSDWPACCESGCEPCVDLLASAARRARALLKT